MRIFSCSASFIDSWIRGPLFFPRPQFQNQKPPVLTVLRVSVVGSSMSSTHLLLSPYSLTALVFLLHRQLTTFLPRGNLLR